jgi:hypothetical protein
MKGRNYFVEVTQDGYGDQVIFRWPCDTREEAEELIKYELQDNQSATIVAADDANRKEGDDKPKRAHELREAILIERLQNAREIAVINWGQKHAVIEALERATAGHACESFQDHDARGDGYCYICEAIYKARGGKAVKVMTEDGFKFVEQSKGAWGDGDMSWASFEAMLASLREGEIRYQVFFHK